jgi:hypothetical protein
LSIDEFLINIKGDLNDFRRGLIRKVFDKLDIDKNGVLEYSDVKEVYNGKKHPDVKQGLKTEQEVI